MVGLAERIEALDVSLFDRIETQLATADRRSLLAIHAACRLAYRQFGYLEIGSHLGGSLQAVVCDPAVSSIISIDSRPPYQADERGFFFEYPQNTTRRMLAELSRIPGADLSKLVTIDASTDTVDPTEITPAPRVCFVDGEHTDEAALRDARFCAAVMRGEGCVVFHDAQIVYRGLSRYLGELEARGVSRRSYVLPRAIFVIEFGSSRLVQIAQFRDAVLGNAHAYLEALLESDVYRTWYTRSPQHRIRQVARAVRRRVRS